MVCRLVFIKKRGILQKIMRILGRTKYDHVGIEIEGIVWSVTVKKGVYTTRLRRLLKGIKRFEIHEIHDVPDLDKLRNNLMGQYGKWYDFTYMVGYFFKRDWQDKKKWVSSELIAWAFEDIGQPLVPGPKNYISPEHLLKSIKVR